MSGLHIYPVTHSILRVYLSAKIQNNILMFDKVIKYAQEINTLRMLALMSDGKQFLRNRPKDYNSWLHLLRPCSMVTHFGCSFRSSKSQ